MGFNSFRPRSKYGSVKTIWKDEVYDSIKERNYAMWLESEKQAGRVLWWRRQIPINLEVNGKLITKMKIDFLVGFPDGTQEYHEVKSQATKADRAYNIRRKLFLALNPDITYKIID